jgi:hypothetical protein
MKGKYAVTSSQSFLFLNHCFYLRASLILCRYVKCNWPTSGGRSVGIVRSRNKATELLLLLLLLLLLCHETTWGNGGIAPPSLISALDQGEWSASRLCPFAPGEMARGTHWIGGWVGLIVGLDAARKRKKVVLSGIEAGPSSPSLFRLTYVFVV